MEGAESLSTVRLAAVFEPIEMKWNKRQDGERQREESSTELFEALYTKH